MTKYEINKLIFVTGLKPSYWVAREICAALRKQAMLYPDRFPSGAGEG